MESEVKCEKFFLYIFIDEIFLEMFFATKSADGKL